MQGIRSVAWAAWILAAVVVLSACTGTAVGTAVKIGEINKTGVELAMSEVIRMDCASRSTRGAVPGCTKTISDADYKVAEAAYAKYEAAQRAYADGVIAWTRLKSAENDQRLAVFADQLKLQTTNAAKILCSFKSSNSALAKLCVDMGV